MAFTFLLRMCETIRNCKMKAGSKYKNVLINSGANHIYECMYASKHIAVLKSDLGELHVYSSAFFHYEEVLPERKYWLAYDTDHQRYGISGIFYRKESVVVAYHGTDSFKQGARYEIHEITHKHDGTMTIEKVKAT